MSKVLKTQVQDKPNWSFKATEESNPVPSDPVRVHYSSNGDLKLSVKFFADKLLRIARRSSTLPTKLATLELPCCTALIVSERRKRKEKALRLRT
jgi:hypothetical protein